MIAGFKLGHTELGVLFLAPLFLQTTRAARAEDVERLFQEKVNKQNKKIRPVLNQSDMVDIEMRVNMVALLDLNEVEQSVAATVWMEVFWKNELLVWDASDYGNLTMVYPSEERMWKPDLALSNGFEELNPVGQDFFLMRSYHDGRTIWYPGQKIVFLCKIDVSKFPFDTQTCYMEFFNWSGTKEESTLNYREPEGGQVKVEASYPNSEWAIIDYRTEKQKNKAHETVRVILVLKRKSLSLVLTVLLPVILLSFLNVFVFLLPNESGEKLSFSVTVLLSQAVFLSYISGLMPQTSETISGLSIYISVQLVLSTIYVLLTCYNLGIYHRDTNKTALPRWILKVLCISEDRYDEYPPKEGSGKLGEGGITGLEVSLKIDRICFWLFLFAVILMTVVFLTDGLSLARS